MAKEETQNITLTLPNSIVEWLDGKVAADDTNRSQVARKIFREAKAAEEVDRADKIVSE
jgi:hypothetical protein